MTIRYSKRVGILFKNGQTGVKAKYENMNRCKIAFYGRDFNCEYKYYLSSTVLESADVIKDLSVVFDSKLSFVSHCKEKINRAYTPCWV